MIYDCCCFFNENELLELRLNTLNKVVDKFVIIESNKTHAGNHKPQNFDIERFSKFKDKIIYTFIENMPPFRNSWQYENYQRDYILEILKNENVSPDDIIIVSDLDEIASVEAIELYKQNPNGIVALSQRFYNGYLNLFNETETPWLKARILSYKDFNTTQTLSPTDVRFARVSYTIPNGGWHFSYMGGADCIIKKLREFAHQEFNNDYYINKERIEECLKNNTDILARKHSYKKVELDESFPKYLLENQDKYKEMILS